MSWPVLVFDIESIPDVAGLRVLRGDPPDASDEHVYASWLQERKDRGQSDFTPLHLQRILVISCVFRNAEGLRVHSFVDRDNASEGKVIQTFFNTLEK
ncbi:MAG TPA: 3'-5' exonuclease, partial [Ramlibacter sp.]|nr:3'-5' exonuclease [Ramlibacter sp.]